MQVKLDNYTRLHLVAGDPIRHSLSPAIYNTLYKEYNMNVLCTLANIKKGKLSELLSVRDALNIAALNLTIPHKSDIIPLLTHVDTAALEFNAVNTVKFCGEELHGFSTDADGFMLSLAQEGISVEGQNVAIIGAGGASSTLAAKAAQSGAKSIAIAARDVASAQKVAENAQKHMIEKCSAAHLSNLSNLAVNTDILINTTPLGMHGYAHDFEDLSFISALKREAVVCDIVYNPENTSLLTCARQAGLKAVGGIGMLIWQAFAAFEIFYGIRPSANCFNLVQKSMNEEGFNFNL